MENKVDVNRAIAKLQVAVNDSKRELQLVNCLIRIENVKAEYLRVGLKGTSEMDPTVLMCEGYDHIFMSETLKYVQENLKDKINTCERKVEELEFRKLCVECVLLTTKRNLQNMEPPRRKMLDHILYKI